jgi:DNA invertase Pin-like site-specific DNA recombinase
VRRTPPPATLEDLEGKDALVYVRVSTKRQAKRYGIPAQLERTSRFAKAYGLTVLEVYEDDRTGTNASRRDAFQALIAAVSAGRAQVVIVAYVSRWARNEFDGFGTLQRIHEAAGCLVIADRALLSTDRRRFTELARELVEAGDYSRKLSETISTTIEEHVRLRADAWGELPYGFRRGGEHRTARPDPGKMPTAVRAWELSAVGHTDRAIAEQLGLTLWTVRGILRSPLYEGRLRDGRPARWARQVPAAVVEQALEHRRTRTRIGERITYRVHPLSGGGPLVCGACGRPIKGNTKRRDSGERVRVYRHHDEACPGWPVRETPAAVLEDQVEQLLAGAKPNRQSAARIRAALATPPVGPDRMAIARLDARIRGLALELGAPERARDAREVLEEIDALRAERATAAATPAEMKAIPADEALAWLGSLAALWRDTDDEGRRALTVGIFARLAVVAGPARQSHRIVEVEPTVEADRRGLALALPTRLQVTLVGGTGAPATGVTWRTRIVGRRPWLAASRTARSA